MAIIIGSARIGENNGITGGAPGDQKQGPAPDTKGEVSMQPFYEHKKGWIVLRPKTKDIAARLALAMKNACNNPMIGYNQNERLGVVKYGTMSRVKTNCDCSSLVRRCVMEASGKDPGNFNTATEVAALEKTGLFEKNFMYAYDTKLYAGDILVTRKKGHTAIVVSSHIGQQVTLKSMETIVKEVREGLWGNGTERRRRLTEAGYDAAAVQEAINGELKKFDTL